MTTDPAKPTKSDKFELNYQTCYDYVAREVQASAKVTDGEIELYLAEFIHRKIYHSKSSRKHQDPPSTTIVRDTITKWVDQFIREIHH